MNIKCIAWLLIRGQHTILKNKPEQNDFIEKLPLNVKVGIEEASLPQACDLLSLLLSGIPWDCSKNHESPALFWHLQ